MALDPVTVFLQQYPPAQRKALQAVRTTILKALPGAEEGIAWGMPATLLRKILRVIVEEINRSYPRKNQVMKQFYVNGRLKAKGRMKDGQKVGVWRTYAADGRQLT